MIKVEYWGDGGEWFVTPGHVNLDAFDAACVRQLLTDDPSMDDDDLALRGPATHRFWRLANLHDCKGNAAELNWKRAEGWRQFTDDPTEEGAEPVTVMETGA